MADLVVKDGEVLELASVGTRDIDTKSGNPWPRGPYNGVSIEQVQDATLEFLQGEEAMWRVAEKHGVDRKNITRQLELWNIPRPPRSVASRRRYAEVNKRRLEAGEDFGAYFRNGDRQRWFNTKLEDRVAELLTCGFRRQVKIGKRMVDFELEDGRLLEAHGCYWHGHGCKVKAPAEHRVKSDARDEELRATGRELIVVWECDVWQGRWAGHV